jgi:hypothetical protein
MGIFDKAKDVLGDHVDKVDEGVDKAADYADEKTGNKYSQHIDQGSDLAKEHLGDYLGAPDQPVDPPAGAERPA